LTPDIRIRRFSICDFAICDLRLEKPQIASISNNVPFKTDHVVWIFGGDHNRKLQIANRKSDEPELRPADEMQGQKGVQPPCCVKRSNPFDLCVRALIRIDGRANFNPRERKRCAGQRSSNSVFSNENGGARFEAPTERHSLRDAFGARESTNMVPCVPIGEMALAYRNVMNSLER
jgi:hypothetical protein